MSSLRVPILTACLLAIVFVGLFLAIVLLVGGLRTTGPYLDWEVVAALATSVAAIAALGALATIGYGIEQLQAAKRNERLSQMPYLRIDVGFADQASDADSRFAPPEARHVFAMEDFGPDVNASGLEQLAPPTGQGSRDLVLWVTNKQRAALGAAFRVRVGLYFAWRLDEDADFGDVTVVEVRFTYVEAEKTTALCLAPVRTDVRELIVTVFSVSYYGMYPDRELRNRHGALSFYYAGGDVQNDRSVELREIP